MFRMMPRRLSVVFAAALGVTAGIAGCGAHDPVESSAHATAESVDDNGGGVYNWWRTQRDARQATYDGFLAQNKDQFLSFKNAAVGNLGIPMVMFRLFPELFPDLWGGPNDHYAPVGLHADTYEPQRALPLGVGFAASDPPIPTPAGPVNVNVVALTCMGCHGGFVQKADGTLQAIPGAPNTQFDGFRGAVARTVNDPRYTADAFRAALNAKPLGWVYNDPTMIRQEAMERAIFNAPGVAEQFLAKLQGGSNFFAARFAATLAKYTYGQTPNAPDPYGHTPGYLDAIGAGITIIVDPTKMTEDQLVAALPPRPAMIDIMSVWSQKDRPAAQWDGSIQNHLHRNLAAEFGVIGDPNHLNMQNVNLTTPFTDNMPAPPYPFDVERDAAARGQRLYGQYCASCHTAGNATIFATADVGTDPNRAILWKPFTVGALRQILRMACTDPITCNHPDGTPLADTEIVNPTGGYMALPLDGIWARAPYLHNGSVPTLAALLTKDRPAQFWRGNVTFDEQNVGFTWDKAVAPNAAIFDTTKSGNGSAGHDTAEYLGDVDWKNEPGKLHDLLEFMKTL